MALTDKIFGLLLMATGIGLALYWTLWIVLSLPIINRKNPIYNYFLEPYYLFKLPAFALIAGLILVDVFMSRTSRRVAEEKARKAMAEQ